MPLRISVSSALVDGGLVWVDPYVFYNINGAADEHGRTPAYDQSSDGTEIGWYDFTEGKVTINGLTEVSGEEWVVDETTTSTEPTAGRQQMGILGSSSTGLVFAAQDLSEHSCFYSRASGRAPDGVYDVGFDGTVYKKTWPSGCSTTNPGMNFDSGQGWVRAARYRSSDFTVCYRTSQYTIPSGVPSHAVGVGYYKSGSCASATQFTVRVDGQVGYLYNNYQATTNSF